MTAAAATEDADVCAAALLQQVDHVLEVLDVAALVGADGDALHVFLQGGGDHLVDRAVVPEVHDLGAHALQDAPHDVDGGVVAVEQAGRGDEAHLVHRPGRRPVPCSRTRARSWRHVTLILASDGSPGG